jgi:Fe-S cluster biogenesis protein NfuA
MTEPDKLHRQMKSIEILVGRLEEASDPALRTAAKDLIAAVMELHGAALQRMLEIAREGGILGTEAVERFGRDDLVRNMLLLYDLHPHDLTTRVEQALQKAAPFLRSHNASAELESVTEDGVVTVHFQVKAGSCGSTAASVRSGIEAEILSAAPDAPSVVITEVGKASGSGFISVHDLQNGQSLVARSTGSLR